MPLTNLSKAARFWPNLADTIFISRTEAEYNRLVAMLDELIDEVGKDEAHPLASLMEILGVLIKHYENANAPQLV